MQIYASCNIVGQYNQMGIPPEGCDLHSGWVTMVHWLGGQCHCWPTPHYIWGGSAAIKYWHNWGRELGQQNSVCAGSISPVLQQRCLSPAWHDSTSVLRKADHFWPGLLSPARDHNANVLGIRPGYKHWSALYCDGDLGNNELPQCVLFCPPDGCACGSLMKHR